MYIVEFAGWSFDSWNLILLNDITVDNKSTTDTKSIRRNSEQLCSIMDEHLKPVYSTKVQSQKAVTAYLKSD